MNSVKFVKNIRNYAIASFLVPLIAINSCLLIYKYLGNMNLLIYENFNWNEVEHTYAYNQYHPIHEHSEYHKVDHVLAPKTFTNCPKYIPVESWTSIDDQTISFGWYGDGRGTDIFNELLRNNKLKSVTIKSGKILNYQCVKNHQFTYSLLKKYSWLETLLIHTVQSNVGKDNRKIGFSKIKNPYFYGEVSISRTARYFPAVIIFKSLIILSAFFLFSSWKNNLNFFTELKNNNILAKFSKKFFYLGIFSCIFLALHATFLGLDFDSILFSKIRRLIIILFILLEVFAQIFLTRNLFRFREELKKYINPLILKIKIIFVIIVFFTTCLASIILAVGDPSAAFKHILEWNYFAFLLFYYLLSRLLWKAPKTQVHTPEGV